MSEIKKNEGKLLGITDELLATATTAQAKKRFGEPPIIKKRILKPTDKYKHILSPLKLNDKFTMKNRVMCAPMVFGAAVVGNEYGNAAYAPGKYSKVEMPAAGGTAMVSVGEIDINSREAKRMPLPDVDFTIRSGEAFNAISEYAWRIKRHGAIALHELCHCGQMKPAIPGTEIWGPVAGHTPDGGTIIPFDEEMMQSVCNDFANAALYMQDAGFDGVCIHAGHGFLFTQFLSARVNTRTDEYGGSLENRAKFPLRILKAIRDVVEPGFLIEIRVSGTEGVPGGMEIEEVAQFIQMCEGIIDGVHISSGLYDGVFEDNCCMHSVFCSHAYNAERAAYVKARTSLPVGLIGYINDPDLAESLIADGKCDYVVLGRQLIADPDFVHKLEEGREKEIRKCIGCVSCFEFPDPEQNIPFDGVMPWLKVGNCAINPQANMLKSIEELPRPEAARKVVIVGGGPAGMQAAITAHDRGHKVVLMEKNARLGGTLFFAEVDVDKGELATLVETMTYELSLRDVDVRLNTVATAEAINQENPDIVILAVGAHAKTLPIAGLDNAIPALDVYRGAEIGKRVVMVGGGLVGTETGLHLAKTGHDVVVVEALFRLAHESCGLYRAQLMEQLGRAGIASRIKTRCAEIRKDGVLVLDENGTEEFIPADTVIYALGMEPNSTDELAKVNAPVVKIGDCSKVAKIGEAIKGGFQAAIDIL